MNDKFKIFFALQCLLRLAWSNYLPSDESYKSSIVSSEVSESPRSDPYHFNDDEDYFDSVDYLDDFEKPYTSGSNDIIGSVNGEDDNDDDYPSFLEDDDPQYGIVDSYDYYRRGRLNKRERTLSGDDDGIKYFSADVPEYVSSTDDSKDDDDSYDADDINLF